MGTVIYNNTSPENFSSYDAVGQVADSGIVYTSPFSISATTAIGQVYDDGIVYNRINAKSWEFAVGHVNASGVIYSTPSTEYNDDAIGHVNGQGVIYCTPFSEYNTDIVGHVDGPDKRAAAAAFLLLMGNRHHHASSGHSSQQDLYGPGLTSKLVGALTDMEFRIWNKLHGVNVPCKNCGKKLDPKDYAAQDGYCLMCYAKEQTRKQTGQKPAAPAKPSTPVQPKPAASAGSKPKAPTGQDRPKAAPQKQSGGIWGKNIRFTKCPFCHTKFKVIFPAGVRKMEKACPNCQTNLVVKF